MKLKYRTLFLLTASVSILSGEAPRAEADDGTQIEADVVYGHKDGLALTMDIFKPDSDAHGGTIVFIVSGGWYSRWAPPEKSKQRFQEYLDAGYTVAAVRHGSSPRYTIPEAVADVTRAIRFLRLQASRLEIDPERLGVWGMSAGGHLALMAGTTGDDGDSEADDELSRTPSRVAAVVAYVPPTDLRVAVWDAPESLPAYRGFPALNLEMSKAEENSPLVHVTPDDAPALVIMGGADKLVPPKHGDWIDAAFEDKEVPRKLIIVPDVGHGLGGEKNRDMVGEETMAWFNQHLLPSESSP